VQGGWFVCIVNFKLFVKLKATVCWQVLSNPKLSCFWNERPRSQPSAYEAESRTAWHAARKRGLGGSDIAAVLGVSPWQKPMDVWLSKTGMVGIQIPHTCSGLV
jgi:hypothetical protein